MSSRSVTRSVLAEISIAYYIETPKNKGQFAVKYIYRLLMNPFDITAMPKSPQILRKSHTQLRIKLYE